MQCGNKPPHLIDPAEFNNRFKYFNVYFGTSRDKRVNGYTAVTFNLVFLKCLTVNKQALTPPKSHPKKYLSSITRPINDEMQFSW
jgi:hypothetical protein